MALTNPQYDAIMRMYNERQLRHQREQQEHIRIAYEKIPRLAEIDAEIASLSVRKAKAMLNGDASVDLDLNAAIRDRSQERAALLSMHGYPADYLELTYDCPLCRDTGYINGTQKCACFKKAAVDLLYRQSNVEELLKAENFSQFSLDYYSDSLTSTGTPLTSREAAAAALEKSQAFVRNFGSSFENLFFYGDTGVGKTFLSHGIRSFPEKPARAEADASARLWALPAHSGRNFHSNAALPLSGHYQGWVRLRLGNLLSGSTRV